MTAKMSNPVAVVLGDVHFSVSTLELASAALEQARDLAKELSVPLIINGDLLDGKAVIRGECANRLIRLLSAEEHRPPRIIVNIGNHDLLAEKSLHHSLNFLRPYAEIIDKPTFDAALNSWFIPYFNDGQALEAVLKDIPAGSRLFMHQGVLGADMGAYAADRTSLPTTAFADFRVISSHFHRRQDIKCGRPRKSAVGLYSFIGSPYSITFAEANDGPKGNTVVYDDGTTELFPTNLRKHVKLDITVDEQETMSTTGTWPQVAPNDLLWVVLRGPASRLEKVSKAALGAALIGHSSFRLEKITDEAEDLAPGEAEHQPPLEVLTVLIDKLPESAEQKTTLKALAVEILA